MNSEVKLRRGVRAGLVLLGLCVVQTLIFPDARLWGVCPQLFPLAALIVGMREGPEFGGWFGMAAGAFLALTTPGFSLLLVPVLTLLGMGGGVAARVGLRQDFQGSFFCTAGGMVLLELGQAGFWLVVGDGNPASLFRIAGPEFLWSMVWFAPVYGLFALTMRRKEQPL